MALAQDFDAGKDIDTPDTPEVPDAEQAPEKKTEAAAKPDTPKPDEVKSEAVSKETKDTAPKNEPPKEQSKWAQNEARKARTWQEINAEKEALKAEKEAITREKQAIEQSRRMAAPDAYRDEHGHTAKDYKQVAEKYRRDGDGSMADAAEKLAQNIGEKEQQFAQQRQQAGLQAAWTANYEKSLDKYPDLKDQNSAFFKEVMQTVKDFPALQYDPDGLKHALRLADVTRQAREFEGTKTELSKLKEEHSKLQKKLSIAGGPPTGAPSEPKAFDAMSLSEQRAHLERAANSHDRSSGYE